jgi:para-aminobenzoate synthetase component 1
VLVNPAVVPRSAVDGHAWFAGVHATHPVACIDLADLADAPDGVGGLAGGGFWAVVGEFDGPVRAWRFAEVDRSAAMPPVGGTWRGPALATWSSSTTREEYLHGVEVIRERIREGDVYQVNLCRVLSAALPAGPGGPDAAALGAQLAIGNPAQFAGGIHVPVESGLPPVWVVTASPELFLRVADGRLSSGPIKGTATVPDGLLDKDTAENVMITDMVRNDLQRVCVPGTVEVSALLELQAYPGLVHLVSTVTGTILPGTDWRTLLRATYPPASVSGAPKHTALQVIAELEPAPRGPYCGAVGWVDADTGRAELAVGIRTFWWADGMLRFGTGAGITWGSDAGHEWAETELKAARLVALASATG